MTSPVIVYLDGDPLRSGVLEVLTLARGLGDVIALSPAPVGEQTVQTLGHYGVSRVLHVTADDADLTAPAAVGQGVADAAEELRATAVLLTSSFPTKEIAAHVAHRLAAGLLVDVGDLHWHEERLAGTKRAFGGTWDTSCAVTTARGVATVRPHAVAAEPAREPITAEVGAITVGASTPTGLELVDRQAHESSTDERPALAEAAVVVAGGRGTFGDFDPVHELADALGAAVGTTRDCVDEGWLPHDAQVGQTGVTVAPRLYIGAGISGAPHHIGGMSAARTIVAVNIDAEAPLVEMADFAVVGDLATVLTDAAEAIREHRGL
ncbi:electron transfer flavoprotein subunit alpha/FixB family protein [Ruania halotolerans]|uniref:electron transfer flavoprotein subunit alpha/FixB family protein n=1 Tax=Ruania halotolerans TaxID=2897773 RepID=UPI001E3A08A7|nr:electron transfer flavoprotein subunit alpha/FixB family protein [Ruania halotolerans]UFU07687.1 electron transfer flavoprotein subunit alpha/FixB family protein [Ruania halotolerans]